MFKPSLTSIAFAALPLLATASVTQAAFTTVGPPHGNELSHAEILGQMYGGTFVVDGLGFTNGSLKLQRLDDDDTTTLTPDKLGTLSDPIREAGIFNTMAVTPDGPVLTGKGSTFFANPADNADGLDHLVVYYAQPDASSGIKGNSFLGDIYVLFWDDVFGDRDFQDFVTGTTIAAVPLPPAALGALLAIAPLAIQQFRRRQW